MEIKKAVVTGVLLCGVILHPEPHIVHSVAAETVVAFGQAADVRVATATASTTSLVGPR